MNISINDVTIISSYYGPVPHEVEFLKKRITQFHNLRKYFPDIKMIIVDDGSPTDRLEFVVCDQDLTNIELVRIKKDLGFNSHGARNLGMHLSKSEWNLLMDLDIGLTSLNLDVVEYEDNPNNIYSFAINTMLIHKQVFNSCKGYDEEFVNIHYGDTIMLDYFKKKFNFIETNTKVRFLRRGRKLIFSSAHEITEYPNLKFTYQPKHRWDKLNEIETFVKLRYLSGDFTNKKTLNFEWEIVT